MKTKVRKTYQIIYRYVCREGKKIRARKLERFPIHDNHDVCESTENLHLKVLEDAKRSGKGVAFRCLFLFSSNFLGGAERKVTLKGINTLYRLYARLEILKRNFFPFLRHYESM